MFCAYQTFFYRHAQDVGENGKVGTPLTQIAAKNCL